MKIQFLSDLHLEMDRTSGRAAGPRLENIPDVGADLVVLAGDVDTGVKGARWAIDQASRLGRPLIYVLGNHEFYGQATPRLISKARAMVEGTMWSAIHAGIFHQTWFQRSIPAGR